MQALGFQHPDPIRPATKRAKALGPDLGRFVLTSSDADRYFFRVPSLRNVAETGPYFHDGSIEQLEEAIRPMAYHPLDKELSRSEPGEIAAFLRSLTGQTNESYIAWPEPLTSGPDTPEPHPH